MLHFSKSIALPLQNSKAVDFKREILSDQVIVLKNHHNIHFKFDFEISCFQRGASKQPGKHHVDGNGQTLTNVAISYLDVLNFCGISGVTLDATASFHPHQLQLDALDGHVQILHHQLARQWLGDDAVCRVKAATDFESRQRRPLFDILQRLGSDAEIHRAGC